MTCRFASSMKRLVKEVFSIIVSERKKTSKQQPHHLAAVRYNWLIARATNLSRALRLRHLVVYLKSKDVIGYPYYNYGRIYRFNSPRWRHNVPRIDSVYFRRHTSSYATCTNQFSPWNQHVGRLRRSTAIERYRAVTYHSLKNIARFTRLSFERLNHCSKPLWNFKGCPLTMHEVKAFIPKVIISTPAGLRERDRVHFL